MPRIAKSAPAMDYVALRAESSARQETRDCTVIATAAALGLPYEVAHAELAALGRKPGQGFAYSFDRAQSVFNKHGRKLTRVWIHSMIDRYPGVHKNLRNVTTNHPERFPQVWADGNTYLMWTDGHILTIQNGRVLDWTKGTARRAIILARVDPL